MEPQPGIKTWQWVVTVIVIIALIIIGIIVFGNKGTQAPTTETENPTTTQNPSSVNRITMTDQYPGNVVFFSSVQVSQPSWVVVQADNNGQPGKILGSAHFDSGINPGKITLTQPMVDGGTYYAVIYTDDGSGKFSATADKPMKDQNGNVIMRVFHATTAASAGLKG